MNQELYIFEVNCEPTDGTHMFQYIDAVIVAAHDENEAIQLADDEGLRGDKNKFTVKKIAATKPQVISSHYTQDY